MPAFWDATAARRWESLADCAVAEARDRLFVRLEHDEEALSENVRGMPFENSALMRSVARRVVRGMRRKYADTVQQGSLEEALSALRQALDVSSGDYIAKHFSYADIAATTMLDVVQPVSEDYVHQGPASRRCWTDERLATEYADLLAWRDRICASHRRKRVRRNRS